MDINLDLIKNEVLNWAPRLAAGLLILIVGWWIAGRLASAMSGLLQKRDMDNSVRLFLKSLTSWVLKILVILSVLGTMGVQMTSFIALLGAVSLAIGMALSGTLQNVAGGVIILILKNFQEGDYIELLSYAGTVEEVNIFNTVLRTPDNVRVILPNGPVSTSSLKNYSSYNTRRMDLTFGIAYGASYDEAKKLLDELVQADERILQEPEPFYALRELADSSVNIMVRVWTSSSDFWPVQFEFPEKVYKKFNEVGMEIPFPQMDLHIHKDNEEK